VLCVGRDSLTGRVRSLDSGNIVSLLKKVSQGDGDEIPEVRGWGQAFDSWPGCLQL